MNKHDKIDNNQPDKPIVYGLVLAGGRSRRMGKDKGKLAFEGKELRLHIYDKLSPYVEKCFLSVREDQEDELKDYPLIIDQIPDIGPIGALISAFMYRPNVSWLVVACDQVLTEGKAFEKILKERDSSKVATVYSNKETNRPDPFTAIWEPKSYSKLLEFHRSGNISPTKVLNASDIKIINPENKDWLFNMNTPEDTKKIDS